MSEKKHIEIIEGIEVHFTVPLGELPHDAIDRFCPYCGAEDSEEEYSDEWPYFRCKMCGLPDHPEADSSHRRFIEYQKSKGRIRE